ncbi:hypothetical protein H0H92_000507, partial [Tricholoma furcatifolium]
MESKGYRIYWPGKRMVTVERDVYFDKDAALNPDSVQIEGEWWCDSPDNLTIPESNTPQNASSTSQIVSKDESIDEGPPGLESVASNSEYDEFLPKKASNSVKITQDTHSTQNSPSTTPNNAPHLRKRRDSRSGLPQYDPNEYGRGQHRGRKEEVNMAETAMIADVIDGLDPS